ncbi:inositol monophosphatase 3-like isoform X2 [Homarus americanus]|uniref:inositol monophosphatase 3-like isoform X2 n=1 Tax=Homarus americanus TaxID=6706 RepID=UPI001C47A527|nr:inositol monophosphatase 3-like isoform X2 [Homarus americanus]
MITAFTGDTVVYPHTHYKMNLGATIKVNKFGVGIIFTAVVMVAVIYRYGSSTNLERSASSMVSLRDLLSAAIDSAQRGGKIVYAIREAVSLHEKSKGKTKEGANDPVTDGDIQSHLTMYYSLKKAFPSLEIISEEHSVSVDTSKIPPASTHNLEVISVITDDIVVPAQDIQVWIDPLDATQEYTENLREYVTTMVCVAVKGHATIGVIHKPFSKFTAWGWAGKGVSPQLQASVSQGGPKDEIAHIIVSRSHAGEVESVAKAAFGDKTQVIHAGGAGYKTLAVIQGDADAYVHVTLIKKWDLCAGNAVLNALHGNMTTLSGQSIDYSSNERKKIEGRVGHAAWPQILFTKTTRPQKEYL